MRYSDYIPVEEHWFDMFTKNLKKKYWQPHLKIPINHIKVDKSLLTYQNEVSERTVLDMALNFDRELWMPITVNKEYYLLDGQHRLAVAKRLRLNYIDVVVQDTELLHSG